MMSSGVCVVDVWAELLSDGQVEVKAALSDGRLLQLKRSDEEDLTQMMKRLVDGFHDDRETLSSNLLTGVVKVTAAEQVSHPEERVLEVNQLLKTIIKLPQQSEAVLAFFEPSAADWTFRQEDQEDQEDQDHSVDQSPMVLSEVMTSNGFCLANTETILFDLTPPTHYVSQSDDSSGRRDDGQTGEEAEFRSRGGPAPSARPFHLLLTWTEETDILD